MKNKNKFTDKYDPNYKDMLSSNVYNDPKKNKNKKILLIRISLKTKKITLILPVG